MNLIKFIIPSIVIFFATAFPHNLFAACSYSLASKSNTSEITNILKETSEDDKNKIVILPEKFLHGAVEKSIEEKKMYVALNSKGELCAIKKLFILTVPDETKSILSDEIRTSQPSFTHLKLEKNNEILLPNNFYNFDRDTLYIYNGGDLTSAKYRNLGINTHLTKFAFQHLATIVKQNYSAITKIALLYGLTYQNANGKNGHILSGRTNSIIKAFKEFLLETNFNPETIVIQRFEAFMPTFDSCSETLAPLPDPHAVPGFGYVVQGFTNHHTRGLQ